MPKYYLQVLGCAMNISDAERIRQVLADLRYTETKSEKQAQVLISVACSVRKSAIDRTYGKIHNWQKLKKTKKITTILTGCVLPTDKLKLAKKFDYIFDIKDLNTLPKILGKKKTNYNRDYFKILPARNNKYQALIPIMTGCNNFCSYCAVPYVRGREKSRPFQEIIKESQNAIQQGYKEIMLVGQNVNSYADDFPKLLETIAQLPGDFWIKFISPHPKDTTLKLIKVITKNNKICKLVHLPLQAGSNKILKAMNRPYTQIKYLKLIADIYQFIPNVAISTDCIVGFPGETRADFNESKKVFKTAKFAMAYLAQYSPRPETAASLLTDNISHTEKATRENELNKILSKTALNFNKKYLNQSIKVLIIKKDEQNYFGITEHSKNVKIKTTKKLTVGSFQQVFITQIETWKISGEIK